jgi:hypothetical protein
MATWTTPKTWVEGYLVDEDDLNEQLRDNLDALKEPPTDSYVCDEASDYTTTSTSFVDVDATNLSLTITTTGGDVMVGFFGTVEHSAASSNAIRFDVDLDGSVIGGDAGLAGMNFSVSDQRLTVSFVYLVTGLSAGTHTFKLQWETASATATLFAGSGHATFDVHPQFWVREVS